MLFCFVEEQAEEESDDNEEDINVGAEAKDLGEESEGDEVDDDEDAVDDDKENKPKPKQQRRQPLGGGNKKILLKQPVSSDNSLRPSTQVMVDEAIKELNEKTGSSTSAIKKFILNKYPGLDENRLKSQMRRYLKKSLTDGKVIQIKMSFKMTNEAKKKQADKEKQKAKLEKNKEKEKEKEKKKKVRSGIIS